MSTLTSRKFAEKDKKELNDSFNKYTGRSRTIKQFEWEWLNTPEGEGSMWLLEDSATGRIVGYFGLIPIKFTYFGYSILTGKTENTFIHPPYAGKGLYYPFEVKFFEEASDRFGLFFTTMGCEAIGAIRLKLGYSSVGGYVTYIKAVQKSYLDKLLAAAINRRIHNELIANFLIAASKLTTIILMPLFRRRGPIDKAIKMEKVTSIDAVADELDKFWERNRAKFGITVDRNSRYLKWRIFDNPHVDYEFFLAIRHGDTVGYLITKINGGKEAKSVAIVDIIADDNDEVIFNSILHNATESFKAGNIHLIQFYTLLSGNFLNKAFRRNGFVSLSILLKLMQMVLGKKEPEILLMAKALDDSLDPSKVSNPACWYFTDMLMEGIR